MVLLNPFSPFLKKKENFPDLASLLWNSACTIAALILELLIQTLGHNSSMVDDVEAISFILSVEIVLACLRIMELGSELSKTMANLPEWNYMNDQDATPNGASSSRNPPLATEPLKDQNMASVEQLILSINDPNSREAAVLELSKKKENFPNLALLLWNSACTIAALLQEVLSIYPDLSSPNLTDGAARRVCNALALFQCVASHPDTRAQFLNAHIPLYLFPLLKTTSMTKPFEYLRLTSLGVIGALVKVDDAEAISFLLSVEIVPVCLCIMEIGSELSRTVATFIVHKILLNEVGIGYMCGTPERFFALCHVLRRMVQSLAGKPSQRLLKQIIRCYLTLSEYTRARESLSKCLPETFMDPSFSNCLGDDTAAKQCLQQLLHNVSGTNQMAPAGLGHMW